jgi:hypothetical protein
MKTYSRTVAVGKKRKTDITPKEENSKEFSTI